MKINVVWTAFLFTATCCQANDVQRETKLGTLRGNRRKVLDTVIEEYLGIPYAEPPTGDLRFKEPVPRSPWKGIYDATIGGSVCPQNREVKKPLTYTEDCLHLNVWIPKNAQQSPVLVWIHGGGFSFGSGSQNNSIGSVLAAKTGFVVVSINYRLGMLGFLNANSPDAPGNQGLLDQNLALKWVRDNIEAFGGDPSMVTIFGDSAGGMSVHSHILSPMSQGLFKRAVMMSGNMYTIDFFDSTHESIIKGNKVAQLVGCAEPARDLASHPGQVLQCLRSKKVEELVLASTEVSKPKIFSFFPTYNDQFIPKVPRVAIDRGFFQDVEVLMGVTTDEGAMSLQFPHTPELLTESLVDVTLDSLDDALRRSKKDGLPSWMRAPHYTDVPYFLALPFNDDAGYTDEDRELCEDVVTMLTSFAKTGRRKPRTFQAKPSDFEPGRSASCRRVRHLAGLLSRTPPRVSRFGRTRETARGRVGPSLQVDGRVVGESWIGLRATGQVAARARSTGDDSTLVIPLALTVGVPTCGRLSAESPGPELLRRRVAA
ncbi:hypothetical protein HPB47_023050 [Ixodes persulcatus]|uniref:Uncharacterized protein n=1 Tax=Ixodes persulcatus TaxID=34615 RepID=A0AC60QA26_IXOPE|nr:hypothetical protein HPB47_023050 [Ixodes persulcatus]